MKSWTNRYIGSCSIISYQAAIVLQALKPKRLDKIKGPVSIQATKSNMLKGIYGIMLLLIEAGFVKEMFDVRKPSDCDHNQVTSGCRSLYEKLVSLTRKTRTEDQAITAITDIPKEHHTGSSQYASVESKSTQMTPSVFRKFS